MKKIVLLVFIFSVIFGYSQEPKKEDVKVGLVLSGGGAKGFAHISAIKAIEKAGVRVDYIGGTSMGAIIGALYASGYTGEQLDSIVRTIDFMKVIADNLPRKSIPFYEKEYGEKYAITLPIKNKKVGIPLGLTYGQGVQNLITNLTQHVSNIEDFRKLPIPFICITTNMETGEQEIMDKGFLPEAVNASGAFPTLFSPIEVDGKLLTDGGVVNNFPVDEVRAMGADVIIGVDIQSGLEKKENLDSAVKVMNQIVGFQMYNTLEEKRNKVDVLIKPDTKGYNVVSFDKVEEILALGEEASLEKQQELEEIAKRQNQNNKKVIDVKPTELKKFHLTRYEIDGNENYTRAYILGKLNLKEEDSTSYTKLIESIDNLSATKNFENIQYKIVNQKGGNVLKLKVKESKINQFLQFGVHYDKLYKTGILINTTSKHIFSKNDILSADLILGDNIRYNFNFFIDNGYYWSFGLKSRYNNFDADVNFDSENVNKINLQYKDLTSQIYVQTVFKRKFAVGVGFEHKHLKAYTETISSINNTDQTNNEKRLYFDKSHYFNLNSYLKLDTYDKKYFQNKGAYINIDYRWFIASSDYSDTFESFSQLKGKVGLAHTFFNKLTTHIVSEAGITIGDNENRALDYNIGGYGENYINNFIPFYGYDFAEMTENSFLRTGITLRYEFLPKNYLSTAVNYGRIENDIFEEGKIFDNTKTGYMVGYGLNTFIGPIEIKYTWSPDHSEDYWYFNIGYWF
ncbi:patatin-like phospholipase family protein [Lutibacter sp. B1]|uniref:patatin-like phospholipase family protein n=1 Tax=Lutibacter sp. B1 TaxID=2725996 RepID=UPI0014578938|nr:patatin-like phospholipase family protein [Lutibacter sp. B1]NLP57810.1 patatin [Lutibacter sp. B1]